MKRGLLDGVHQRARKRAATPKVLKGSGGRRTSLLHRDETRAFTLVPTAPRTYQTITHPKDGVEDTAARKGKASFGWG